MLTDEVFRFTAPLSAVPVDFSSVAAATNGSIRTAHDHVKAFSTF